MMTILVEEVNACLARTYWGNNCCLAVLELEGETPRTTTTTTTVAH